MNILWMTLIAGIGLSLASAMQYKDMRQDNWWHQVSRYYSIKKQELDHQYQLNKFHGMQKEIAYMGQKKNSVEKEKKQKNRQEATLDHPMVNRIKFYPLNTRLPLSKRLYLESAHSQLWRSAYWNLTDALYGAYPFYSQWREAIDPQAFLNELLEGIAEINKQYLNVGTCGLALVHFKEEATQQVWQQMLRGSDRSGFCYPSLMGYVWPVDFINGGYHQVLSLTYANPLTLQALMGPEFNELWQRRSLELKLKALEIVDREEDPSSCSLTHALIELLFTSVCEELSIDQKLYKEMLDFAGKKTKQVPEILLRNERGVDLLQSTQVPYRKTVSS